MQQLLKTKGLTELPLALSHRPRFTWHHGSGGANRRDQAGVSKNRHCLLMPFRSRLSALLGALVLLAGSVFLFEYVLFVGHAVDGREWRTDLRGAIHLSKRDYDRHEAADGTKAKRLAVVVPAHAGDLSKALNSLQRWPTTCYQTTVRHTDLILYYAGGEEDDVDAVLPKLSEEAGRCFARTKLVYAHLTKKENVYPKGPSVQFYKMFLDKRVSAQFVEYDAIALIEWDVIVAHESSFDKLYKAAFGGIEPFWVKGSTLEGVNFHETVVLPESRHVLGHINGNALYNNTDPAFVEFVEFTLTRWEYTHSYDVALWATIADLPYSWPLWQRYSRKFVATDLIANVGFLDVDSRTVGKAIASDTLFIHGSLTGGGGSMFSAHAAVDTRRATELLGDTRHEDKCTEACRSSAWQSDALGTTGVCDRSCSPGTRGPRFAGFKCGAGDPEEFGEQCRMCYVDIGEAIVAEEEAAERNALLRHGEVEEHVIMCDTLLPPPSRECSTKCARKIDTICDESCGRGRFGDYNCNWRGYGDKCRFCFHDRKAALKADEVAKRRGGRVIMCHTYEPPTEEDEWAAPPLRGDAEGAHDVSKAHDESGDGSDGGDSDDGDSHDDDDDDDTDDNKKEQQSPENETYVKGVKRGQLCAFLVGYSTFLAEARVAAKSIAHFMPGMRIAIATHPDDVAVFERGLGNIPGVHISAAPQPTSHAPLLADQHCGEGTRLILYLNPGEMLSRTFTSKDTHSVKGDLLVVYAEVGRVGQASLERTLATTSVLGFSSPSFSFGMDIMLPAKINQQLRDVLLSGDAAKDAKKKNKQLKIKSKEDETSDAANGDDDEGDDDDREENLPDDERALRIMSSFPGAFIPEVLAALAYARNPPGLWFINPQQWVTHHMFERASIWDIPLVKPRFCCAFDISPAAVGYDVAAELEAQLGHFVSGGKCDRGFIALDRSSIKPQARIEFGGPTGRDMPPLDGILISVAFSVRGNVDPVMLDLSLSSLEIKFPELTDVMVIFNDPPVQKNKLRAVIAIHNERASFSVEAIEAPPSEAATPDTAYWSALHVDEYCKGDFIMQMEPGEVLTRRMTYDNIFHFYKPVIPFTRTGKGAGGAGDPMEDCLTGSISTLLKEPMVHEFALMRSLAYPREAFAALREQVRDKWDIEIETAVERGRTSCVQGLPDIQRDRYELSLLGSFVWHFMHDTVEWRALHPLDVQPDEWLSDVGKNHLYCDLRGFGVPEGEAAAERFVAAGGEINSREECDAFHNGADNDSW